MPGKRDFGIFGSGSLMRERRGNQRRKLIQAFGHILAKMYPQRAPVPFGQHLEISPSLRRFHNAKRILLLRHRYILRFIAGNLHEDT